LPIVRTPEVQQRLLELLQANPQLEHYWLGLEYSNHTDGGGIWNTGEIFNPDDYDNFSDSRRLDGERSCAVYNINGNEWRNHNCSNLRHIVCMKWQFTRDQTYICIEQK